VVLIERMVSIFSEDEVELEIEGITGIREKLSFGFFSLPYK